MIEKIPTKQIRNISSFLLLNNEEYLRIMFFILKGTDNDTDGMVRKRQHRGK